MIETVRVTKQGKDRLVTLKRRTGITNWNVLCRWAFCISLSEPSVPSTEQLKGEIQIEMTWRTFGGEYAEIYWALLKERCKTDGLDLDEDTLARQFRLHLHRGIGYLVANPDLTSISGLINLAVGLK